MGFVDCREIGIGNSESQASDRIVNKSLLTLVCISLLHYKCILFYIDMP